MKKIQFTAVVCATSLFMACSNNANTESTTENADSTMTTEANIAEEETENTLTFDGVEQGDYMLYGYSEITPEGELADVATLTSVVEKTGKFEGKVKVTIAEVCQKAGCWITFNDSNDESIRVFFRDHFTIPIETVSGTEAILYGIATQDTTSVDMQKHLLEDAVEAGKEVSQAEIDAITEDKIELTFDCESILVKK
jgi:hypothetical protein